MGELWWMMSEIKDIAYRSHDDRFHVVVSHAAIEAIVCACVDAGRKETGGILIGRIEPDGQTAIVLEATPKPPDSSFGWFWFRRGAKGLKQVLEDRWSVGHHYLGEWHFHPGGSSQPSGSDYIAMGKIARDRRYQMPEPILVILGGRPPHQWEMSVAVVPRGEAPCPMILTL